MKNGRYISGEVFLFMLFSIFVFVLFAKTSPVYASATGTYGSSIARDEQTGPGIEMGRKSSSDGSDKIYDSSGFVLLSRVIPDAVYEIRNYTGYNFVGRRIDGFDEPCALLSREAANALQEAADEFREMGYYLKIHDAYRPQRAVNDYISWAEDVNDTKMQKIFYPDIDKSRLFELGYLSKKSGHSRGSTVDLTLYDISEKQEVDMGSPMDFMGEASHFDYSGITEKQKENRTLLRDIMVKHGFQPISTEWWHFRLQNEPYPDTYFDFPVRSSMAH